MNNITIFCGSSMGAHPKFAEVAYLLGQHLAENNIGLVYGGAKVGLMGQVAQGALNSGGKVVGIIPHFLSGKEILHEELTELIVVKTMHDRKLLMHERCDGVIALPGGFGTMEELFEMLTWGQLGLHQKPIGLLNVMGFYDDLILMIQKMVDTKFLSKPNQNMVLKNDDFVSLIDQMDSYIAPETPKWIKSEDT
jgi:uncharacterized protein (TIGR00730 family)